MKALKLAKVVGNEYRRMTFTFRGVEFFTRTLSGVGDFSQLFVHYATGWTWAGHSGVCSDLIYAISSRFELDENGEFGFWMADKFKSPEQLQNIEKLKNEIRAGGGNPDSRGTEAGVL